MGVHEEKQQSDVLVEILRQQKNAEQLPPVLGKWGFRIVVTVVSSVLLFGLLSFAYTIYYVHKANSPVTDIGRYSELLQQGKSSDQYVQHPYRYIYNIFEDIST